jgi:hypothetical protein
MAIMALILWHRKFTFFAIQRAFEAPPAGAIASDLDGEKPMIG